MLILSRMGTPVRSFLPLISHLQAQGCSRRTYVAGVTSLIIFSTVALQVVYNLPNCRVLCLGSCETQRPSELSRPHLTREGVRTTR
jgi:hypothetical protein